MPARDQLSNFFIDLVTDPIKAISVTAPKIVGRIYPEAATAMKVAGVLADKNRQSFLNSDGQYGDGDPMAAVRQLKTDGYGVPVLVGLPGGGKSTFAVWLARQIGNKKNAGLGMRDYQLPPDFQRLDTIDEMFALPKGSTIIIDDAARFLSIYNSYGKKTGQQVVDLTTLCRHYGFVVIIVCQNTSAVNKHLLDTITTMFIKKPSKSEGFERPALRKPYKQAIAAFKGRSEQWIYEHAYVWSMEGEGLIRFKPTEIR